MSACTKRRVRVPDPTPRLAKLVGTVSTQLVLVALAAVGGIVTARVLQPKGSGTYAVVVAVAMTALSLGHLSIGQSNVFLWHLGEDRRVLATNALALGLTAGTVAAAVAWAVVEVLFPGTLSGVAPGTFVTALAAVPFGMAALYLYGLVVLDDRIGRQNAVRVSASALQVSAIVALAAAGRLTPATVVVIWAVTTALPLLGLLPGLGVRPRRLSFPLARRALGTGSRYHLGMVAIFLLWRVDVFLLNALDDRVQVGLYAIAVSVAEFLSLVTGSVAQVALPRQIVGPFDDAAYYTARVARITAVGSLALVALIALGAPIAIPLLFGSSFRGSVAPLLGLLPGVLALGLIRPVTALFVRLDRPLVVSALAIAALATNVALNFVLIPPLGALGAALASTIAYAQLAGCYVVWLLSATPVRAADLLPRRSELSELVRSALNSLPWRGHLPGFRRSSR